MKYLLCSIAFFTKNKGPLPTPICLLIAIVSAFSSALHAANDARPVLEEVIVTAELLETSVLKLPNSVTVIDQVAIEQRGARQLEDLLNLAPNVNFASGASRGRFIQIRGIGERSEFQEPIINSVGVLLDGIDLTGVSLGATSLDLQQMEVLRGPQGTLYGANALAGLINLVSNQPTEEFFGQINMAIEEYAGMELGGVVSQALNDTNAYRFAVKHFASDGFTDNAFLQRDDTNNFEETSARLKLVSQINSNLVVDSSIFFARINNGYDAFSLDNTRQTYSDQPGQDQQNTVGASVVARYSLSDSNSLEATLSHADSHSEYSFDEDWSHPGICNGTPCDSALFGFDWFYASEDRYSRNNANQALDLRWVHRGSQVDWVAGLYFRDQSIDLTRDYTFNEEPFTSALDTQNLAAYGQVNVPLTEQLSLIAGLRVEARDNRYADSTGQTAQPSETLSGGRLALEYQPNDRDFFYALLSRGYKPGGFNLDQTIAPDLRDFDTETMLNYELGYKSRWLDDRLQLQLSVFYQDRDSIQSKQSIVASISSGQVGGTCPCSFTDFTANASSGHNRGAELELTLMANEQLIFGASLGVLSTEFDDFLSFEHVNADREAGLPFNLNGREQAHAPSYQFVFSADWQLLPQLSLFTSVEGKDDFFFSDRHDERSDAYTLVNMELRYQFADWSLALYGKNLSDELVKTRGFGSFGNDPRKFYQVEPYNQFAAPRVIGVRAQLNF